MMYPIKPMRTAFFLFVLLATGGSFLLHAGEAKAKEMTLQECYAVALQQSESISLQKEYIRETEGQLMQSLSTALPKVAFAYSDKWQDVEKDTTNRRTTPEGKFTFSQPLFTGFKEFAAISGSRHLTRQRELELKRAKELLFTDVADAFYLYLSYQESYEVQNKTKDALLQRVEELKKREVLGKSRPSEVASAESRLRRVEASLELLASQKQVSAQLLEFLTGRNVDGVLDKDIPADAADPERYYAGVEQRADVLAAREAIQVYKKQITVARSSFLPTVTLNGNSYTKRVGTSRDVDWDATVSVNVPLFNGMSDHGQLHQARAQLNEAELRHSQVKRKALLEIRNAYTQWMAAMRRTAALQKALEASQRNYDLQVEDFKRSLVNNLDVLQALEDRQGVENDLVSSRTDASRGYWKLKVAVGEVEP